MTPDRCDTNVLPSGMLKAYGNVSIMTRQTVPTFGFRIHRTGGPRSRRPVRRSPDGREAFAGRGGSGRPRPFQRLGGRQVAESLPGALVRNVLHLAEVRALRRIPPRKPVGTPVRAPLPRVTGSGEIKLCFQRLRHRRVSGELLAVVRGYRTRRGGRPPGRSVMAFPTSSAFFRPPLREARVSRPGPPGTPPRRQWLSRSRCPPPGRRSAFAGPLTSASFGRPEMSTRPGTVPRPACFPPSGPPGHGGRSTAAPPSGDPPAGTGRLSVPGSIPPRLRLDRPHRIGRHLPRDR